MKELQKQFGSNAPFKWYHKPKKQYQVEIPVALLKKKPADKDFELVSQTKVLTVVHCILSPLIPLSHSHSSRVLSLDLLLVQDVNRYWTPTIKSFIKKLEYEQDNLEDIKKTLLQRQYGKFSEYSAEWIGVVSCLAHLDCLLSCAVSSRGGKERKIRREEHKMGSFFLTLSSQIRNVDQFSLLLTTAN